MTTTTDHAATYRLTRTIAPSSSSSSPGGLWGRCAMWLTGAGRWMSRRRYELAPAAAITGITGLGLAQDGLAAALAYGALAAGSGAVAVAGLKHKNQVVTHVGAGGALALTDVTTAVAAGLSWPTLTAWTLTTGAAYGVYGPWLATQRNTRIKLHVDTVKAKGHLPEALGLEAADPGLTGASPEETALRRAVHALTGTTPAAVEAMHRTEHGWSCLLTMPPGRNTSPAALTAKRQQLAANLALPGKLTLAPGSADNQLIVRMATTDALAGTLPLTETGATTCREPVHVGSADDGSSMQLTLLYRHTLIAGASDWGKSGLINLLVHRLSRCTDVQLYGIDMKPGAVELGPWEPVMRQVAKGPEQARGLLEWIRGECDRRGAILDKLSKQSMAEGGGPVRKWVPGVHGDAIFVVTDELAELVRQDKELTELYESLLAIARSNAIQFISATQQPSRKVFGGSTDARGNYGNRLSTRTGEPGHGPFIFGQGCQTRGWRPELLDLPGKFLAQTPEHDQPREYRAQYVTDTDIAAAVQFHYADVRDTEPQPALTDEPWVEAFAPLRYPDGQPVGDAWPHLYRVLAERGSVTKKELSSVGGVSRDTAMRAIEAWQRHGVLDRRDGRAIRYYLPED
jgi:hypothetical protein